MNRIAAFTVAGLALAVLVVPRSPRASAAGGSESLAGVAMQKDGKVVVIGETDTGGTTDFCLARLTRDGVLDAGFGTGGRVILDMGGTDEGGAVVIDKKGRVLVGGDSNTNGTFDLAIARFLKDGTLDPTFGTAGKVITDAGGSSDAILSMALDKKGRILAAGFSNASANLQFVLARYSPDGVLDATFGTGGLVFADFGGQNICYGVAVDKKGRIFLAGISTVIQNFIVARYDDTGTLDPTFGTGGVATADFGGNDSGQALALGKKGTVLVAGNANGSAVLAAALFDDDGVLDPSFADDGLATYPTVTMTSTRSAALDKKGRAHLVGSGAGGMSVVRLLRDGTADADFGTGGEAMVDAGGSTVGRRVALGKAGGVFAAGESDASGTNDMAVALFDKNGVLAPAFSGGAAAIIDF